MKNIKRTGQTVLFVILASAFLAGCSNSSQTTLVVPEQTTAAIQSSESLISEFDAKGVSKSHVLVKVKGQISKSSSDEFSAKFNSKVKRTISRINVLVMEIPAGKTSQQFLKDLKADSRVVYAEPDIKVEHDAVDEVKFNDPMLADQYALTQVEAAKAWTVNQGKASVVVAIVDTGIDLEHPDLKAKILDGYNALKPGTPPADDARHGTHVGGIAAAIGNNGVGVSGLASNCKLLPVKVLGANSGSIASIADGLIWAADHGADVVNMSLGTYTEE